jgi:hypothetical protein
MGGRADAVTTHPKPNEGGTHIVKEGSEYEKSRHWKHMLWTCVLWPVGGLGEMDDPFESCQRPWCRPSSPDGQATP